MPSRNVHRKPSKYMTYLSIWIGFVSLMAFGNTVQCFVDHSFLNSRLYTVSETNVNGLVARLFGIWTVLSGALRLCCAINIYNRAVYNLTLFTFFAVLFHFVSEILIYRTSDLCVGVMAPLTVSSLSIIFMLQGYKYLDTTSSDSRESDESNRKSKKKYG